MSDTAVRDAVIVAGVRTPIGKFGGTFRHMNSVSMGGHVIAAARERSGIDVDRFDEVIVGHARQAGNGPNPARLMAIKGGLAEGTPAYTVNQACVSSMKALILGAQSIALGQADTVMVAGVEHMSSIPYLVPDMRWGRRMGDAPLVDGLSMDGFRDPLTGQHMGELAEAWAVRYGISRKDQDVYACRSQRLTMEARQAGFASRMTVPVVVDAGSGVSVVTDDEHPRPGTTVEQLAKLGPAFAAQGSVTAGNASGVTDGAVALVLMAADVAETAGITPIASVRSWAVAAMAPRDYGLAVAPAAARAVERAGLTQADLDVIEINEAFAIQVLAACVEMKIDPARVNRCGGAIALGHPVGMSGARIILYAAQALDCDGGRYALATICGNGGQAAAVVLERV
jgi:acetyl-CoA C-acetyltransferase